MADDVAITAGSGTSIATDDCTSGHVQLMKLTYGADGNRTHVPADADGLLVNLGANNDVTIAGDALTALQLLDDTVFVDDAAYTLGTSKLTAVGGVAVAHGAAPDAADALDAGAFLMNRHRVQWVIGGHPNVVTSSLFVADSDNGQTNLAIGPGTVAPGAKVVVTRVSVMASNANTVNTACKIGFGTASVPADSLTPAADILAHHPGVPPGGGFTIGDGSGVLGVGADGAEVRLTCGDPTGGSLSITISYYLIES
jgi:hypothetical protein